MKHLTKKNIAVAVAIPVAFVAGVAGASSTPEETAAAPRTVTTTAVKTNVTPPECITALDGLLTAVQLQNQAGRDYIDSSDNAMHGRVLDAARFMNDGAAKVKKATRKIQAITPDFAACKAGAK